MFASIVFLNLQFETQLHYSNEFLVPINILNYALNLLRQRMIECLLIYNTGLAAMKGMMMGGMSLMLSMMMLSQKFGKGGGGGGPWQSSSGGGGGNGGGMFISIFLFLNLLSIYNCTERKEYLKISKDFFGGY